MIPSQPPQLVASKDGTPIAVWEQGDGPPLVLVHGAAADHRRWAPIVPALAEHFRVLAIDRRGRGGSGDGDDYAIELEYEDVATVVDWVGAETAVLGHSYGGICALEAALLTDGIRRLVVYEPPMGFLASPPEVVRRLQECSMPASATSSSIRTVSAGSRCPPCCFREATAPRRSRQPFRRSERRCRAPGRR